jgi:MFS family permease
MITGGRLGDIYGQRRIFMVAFAAFTLTSFVCRSPSGGGRLVQ